MSGPAPATRPWVVLVGGFLGSGKTTLILAAARELQRRGLRSAMVWNDQGKDLVDSRYAAPVRHAFGRGYRRLLLLPPFRVDRCNGRSSRARTGRNFCRAGGELYRSLGHRAPAAARIQRHLSTFAAHGLGRSAARPEHAGSRMPMPTCVSCSTSNCRKPTWSVLPSRTSPRTIRRLAPLHVRQLSAKSGQGVAAWLDEVLSGTIATGDQSAGDRLFGICAGRGRTRLVELCERSSNRGRLLSPAMLLGPLLDRSDAALTAEQIPSPI